MNASEKNALIRQQNKDLSAIYKRKIAQELASVSLTQEKRDNINSLVTEALDNMMPPERVEETKVEEDNVVCKLLLKGYPQHLFASLEPILKSLIVRNTKTGNTDLERTNEYVMTLMLERVKKP
jgi:hypothetical protein